MIIIIIGWGVVIGFYHHSVKKKKTINRALKTHIKRNSVFSIFQNNIIRKYNYR